MGGPPTRQAALIASIALAVSGCASEDDEGGLGDAGAYRCRDGGPAPTTLRAAAEVCSVQLVGAALAASHLAEDEQFASIAASEFNYATPENEMKWDTVEVAQGLFSFQAGDQVADFARDHGMRLKGHTLVWHQQLPAWVDGLADATSARAALVGHITAEVSHFRDRYAGAADKVVIAWDVVNEAFTDDLSPALRNTVFRRLLGDGYIDEAFRAAHAADPEALLFYNDYGAEAPNAKADAIYQMVRRMKEGGVPIDGVGFQTHVAPGRPTPRELARNLQRFTALGLLVTISEMDVRLGELSGSAESKQQAQATTYHDLIAACEVTPGCHAVTLWGITDRYSWLDTSGVPQDPLPWDDQYNKKPAWQAVLDALSGR